MRGAFVLQRIRRPTARSVGRKRVEATVTTEARERTTNAQMGNVLWIALLLVPFGASVQTAVTTTTGGRVGTVPVFTNSSTDIENSIMTQLTGVITVAGNLTVGTGQTTDPKTSKIEVPMAMIGIVPTIVNAENGPIKRGDLLVTSGIPGYAMKGTDRNRMLGAVIGKALGSLESGTGVFEVLVTLQ